MTRTNARCVTLLIALFLLSGCAILDMGNPESPTVKIDGVKVQKIGETVQRLEIALLVQNPNRFDLQLQGLNFTAAVNGERFAKGSTDQYVNVPALGEALLEVQVVLGLTDLLSQAAKLLTAPDEGPLEYSINGTVNLENWPSAIPFNASGEYSSPLE